LRQMIILTPEDWLRFRELFDKQFPNFIQMLKMRFPSITASELRLFLLIKLGFDAPEMANITGISERSVYIARYRLRQRLGLTKEQDLEAFIQSF
jgi:DNA-binding CsgD family transcriptional regulator